MIIIMRMMRTTLANLIKVELKLFTVLKQVRIMRMMSMITLMQMMQIK